MIFSAVNIQLPWSGRAFVWNAWSFFTRSAFTTLLSVRRTISIVGSSVTRRPSTNCGTRPLSLRAFEIALPPPCTSATRMPTASMNAMSARSEARFASFSITDPPTFTSTVEPQKS